MAKQAVFLDDRHVRNMSVDRHVRDLPDFTASVTQSHSSSLSFHLDLGNVIFNFI